jgi:hypothetical protein
VAGPQGLNKHAGRFFCNSDVFPTESWTNNRSLNRYVSDIFYYNTGNI